MLSSLTIDTLSISGWVKSCEIRKTFRLASFCKTSISFSFPSSSRTPVISSRNKRFTLLPPSLESRLLIARSMEVCIRENSPPETVSIGEAIPLLITEIFHLSLSSLNST